MPLISNKVALLPFLRRGKKSINTTYYTMTPDIVGSFATGSRVDCKNVKGQMNAYVNCPPVATLIGAKATAANNAVWWFGKEDGTENLNGSTKLLKDLFERPNEYQDWDRFFSLAYMMNQLFGKAYIYVIQPVGMARRYATSMLVIPNTYVTPIYFGNQTGVYYYNVIMGGQSFKIDPADMMVWNDFTFDISQAMNYMDGQSRLFSLSDPVNNIIAAYEANNTLLTNFGMMGIVSPDPANNIEGLVVPMEDDKKKQVQDDLQKKYGIMRNQWPFLLTGQPVKYTAVGRPTKDLMLIETIKDSVQVLSQAFRYPFSLLGYDSTLTYDNVRISDRMLYSNAIMPELKGFISVFNRYFGNTSDNQLRFSFDHIASMQESKAENAQARSTETTTQIELFKNNIITKPALAAALEIPVEDLKIDPEEVNQTVTLVERIGIGGTQSLIEILGNDNMTPDHKVQALIILFGLNEADARKIIG